MEVILLETFDRLGKIGDVVTVKNGYARNYLIPQKKALRANKQNKEFFSKIKEDLIEKNNKIIAESKDVLKQIENKEIIFIRNASDNGQLYGSVSPKDISNYFGEKKIDVKPSNINLHTSIKKIGIYDINIKLHADVSCNLKINVATSEENAKDQKNKFENEKLIKNIEVKKDSKVVEENSSEEEKISSEGPKKNKSKDSQNIDIKKKNQKKAEKNSEDILITEESSKKETLKKKKEEKSVKKVVKDKAT
ncbi:MAG: 50S ribosomal protein L9 [Pseudomonadota bacterium]|nr:50S ribosomal protein L9 [Pseudomonadota bacterium]